jgi:hypothetical protein
MERKKRAGERDYVSPADVVLSLIIHPYLAKDNLLRRSSISGCINVYMYAGPRVLAVRD